MTMLKRRRNWLITGAGLAALGLGLTWRQQTGPTLSAEALAFWSSRFDRPEGGELITASMKGRPLLLNFWATWCPPCVQELPELAQFRREFKAQGWQVLGLAVDSPTPVREFLQKLPLDFDIGMAGLTGTDLARKLGNTQGGLPFSVAFGANGEVIWRKLGGTNLDELRRLATGLA